ncbi:zinc-binding dehydrogenase [Cohnella ginsengisoli]|uniref:zinc-binding dehydrogenase n=1 Tax=Cohnella ginsengisoli TaxID=425004 RepID=UPI003B8A7237
MCESAIRWSSSARGRSAACWLRCASKWARGLSWSTGRAPRLEMAKPLGAHAYVCSSEENAIERVLQETGGLGADVVITCNPSPDAQVDAIHMAKNRARVNFFGGLPKGQSLVALDTNIIHYKELFVHGAHGSLPRHHRKAVELINTGTIDMKKYISHRFALADIEEAIRTAESHAGMRVIVKP